MQKIAIVGMGYVGLPLALLCDKKGFQVLGLDNDKNKIKKLNTKRSPINEPGLQQQLLLSNVTFDASFEKINDIEVIVICVPTPVDSNKLPNLKPLTNAAESIAKHLKKGALVIIESTVNPGVCDEVVIPIIERVSGHTIGKDVFIAHCPERISPGDDHWSVVNINRVVGADSPQGLKLATNFYESLLDAEIKPMATIKEAEAVKIVENSFRDINIAFVNELAKSFHLMNINLENVIDGAATKPFAFMPHRPGAGVGGHCIPVDPYYLIDRAKGFGFEHKLLKSAREINESMPDFTISLLEEALGKKRIDRKNLKIAVLGQAYKPDVQDCRESPAVIIHSHLVAQGYSALRHDPFAADHSDFDTLDGALAKSNVALIATGHSAYKKLTPTDFVKNNISIVIDGRNIYKDQAEKFRASGILYSGIGI